MSLRDRARRCALDLVMARHRSREKKAEQDRAAVSGRLVRELFYGDLVFPNAYYEESFTRFLDLLSMAFHAGSARILELGAGTSTVLWAEYARRTGAVVCSVDGDLSRLHAYAGEGRRGFIDRHVRLLEGYTVAPAMVEAFYGGAHATLFGLPAAQVIDGAQRFVSGACEAVHRRRLLALPFGSWTDLRRTFLSTHGFLFPPPLSRRFGDSGSLALDLEAMRAAEAGGARVDLLREEGLAAETWDLVFLDSGEFSSVIEWSLLRERVLPGGLVALHDIFYPKSCKNFLVAGALVADPGWEVIALDRTTPQGLLIARRAR